MIIEQAAPTPTAAAVTHAATTQTPSLRISTSTTRGGSSGGFISTAAAQPLQPVPSLRSEQPSPALERLWPYAAVMLCLAGLGMCALAVRKQRVPPAPTWMGAANAASKNPGDTHADLNTFAHFSEMTEPGPAAPREVAEKRDARPAAVASNGELDTLLGDDVINEKTIRDEWAAAASEHAIDIGTDSILQAIATAEREMRIAAPPPAQVAMDQSLDDELLRRPKKR